MYRNSMTVALYYAGEELENLKYSQGEPRENRQTGREFNSRGHSSPQWIVRLSGPILELDYLGLQ